MFKETVDALKAGVSAYELTTKSLPILKRLIQRISGKEVAIAVFGSGGTGKTTLGRILSGESDPVTLSPYKPSFNLETFKLEQDVSVSILVPPGQERRGDQRTFVLEQLLDGKVRVVIDVVAYGYHSLAQIHPSYTKSDLYQSGMSVEQFMEAHIENRKKEEIEQLKRIATVVQMSKSLPTLMLTLVTKQDLWWKERDSVKLHYESSEYNEIIDGIVRAKGTANFSHEYISASLLAVNMDSLTGERLASIAAGYDQRLQAGNLAEVFKKIDSFCQRG